MPFFLNPSLSKVVLDAFHCRLIDGDYYLVADFAEVCFGARWTGNAVLAFIGICLYPIGILVYTGTTLSRNRHKLWVVPKGETGNKMKQRYGLLFGEQPCAYAC